VCAGCVCAAAVWWFSLDYFMVALVANAVLYALPVYAMVWSAAGGAIYYWSIFISGLSLQVQTDGIRPHDGRTTILSFGLLVESSRV
jgi:hypothetical protein